MKLNVKVLGTLCNRFPHVEPGQSIPFEIPERGTVRDLLAALDIPETMRAVVVVEGRVLAWDEGLPPGACVSIFQAVHGG